MKRIYKVLGLTKQKALDLTLTPERLVSHVGNEHKKRALLSELNNISQMTLKFSLKGQEGDAESELQVLEIAIDDPKLFNPIFNAVKDAIPYAVLIVLESNDKHLLAYSDEQQKKKNPEIWYTDWIYEEEISEAFFPYVLEEGSEYSAQTIIEEVKNRFFQLQDSFSYMEYICFRRLVDLLKIRENVWGEEYVNTVVAILYNQGQIEMVDETLYAVQTTYAEAAFSMISSPSVFERKLIDERFGPDMFYKELSEVEATTIEEAEELYAKLERGTLRINVEFTEDNGI